MALLRVGGFECGEWIAPGPELKVIESAVTGAPFAGVGSGAVQPAEMLRWARERGGSTLRSMTFHERAHMLKALARHLDGKKQALYDLSFNTGATQRDHLIDVDGGIGTLFAYSSKGRREMPDSRIYIDGRTERLSRDGSFMGRHVCTSLQGVAVHINAFNFPVWGMLEKLAPALLAGVPAIVKPATASVYVAELAVRLILDSEILPEGTLQFVAGDVGDMLDHLGPQDVLGFTGSAGTALSLRSHRTLLRNAVRFVAEQDSLNACILGPDVDPGSPEFDLFIQEAQCEMTVKAGQKCTAIRRMIVPTRNVEAVINALRGRLSATVVGDPRLASVRMGALVSKAQRADVLAKAELIGAEAEQVLGVPEDFTPVGVGVGDGAFLAPMLYYCHDPDSSLACHEVEAFGPVATVMPYRDSGHAVALANRGHGSLVVSLFSRDADFVSEMVLGVAAWHGRIYINNRDCGSAATGHGSPLPYMVHGGPGRAGGGEELGGIRAVLHYMQRSALQGPPQMLACVTGNWLPGAEEIKGPVHPFTRRFHELEIGETIHSVRREITLSDIEHFAHFTGDTFYAHMDAEAAKRNPFFPDRVAHGYLLLSFAAGLFVEPSEGPVLANTGLDNLRFMHPVVAGDSLEVRLSVKEKTPRTEEYGEVRWQVTLSNQSGDVVAEYELLTMNAC